jgi:hypothetical protein
MEIGQQLRERLNPEISELINIGDLMEEMESKLDLKRNITFLTTNYHF